MILSLTCSSRVGSITLSEGTSILKTLTWESERSHSEFISKELNDLAQKWSLDKLTALAVDVGPGSFTGLRIGVNTVKTLSYALNIPIITATSLEVLAQEVSPTDLPLVTLIDAFSDSVYATIFKIKNGAWIATSAPFVVKSSEIKNLFESKCICVGDGFFKYSKYLEVVKKNLFFIEGLKNVPCSGNLAKIALVKQKNNEFISWEKLEPLYVRRSSAEEKLLV